MDGGELYGIWLLGRVLDDRLRKRNVRLGRARKRAERERGTRASKVAVSSECSTFLPPSPLANAESSQQKKANK